MTLRTEQSIVYLTYDQSLDLVERIAERAENFNHTMIESEKEAMADLISNIGTNVSDIIDVSNLADNYAINAEIVTPDDYKSYNMREVKENSLFSWKDEDGKTSYCLTW